MSTQQRAAQSPTPGAALTWGDFPNFGDLAELLFDAHALAVCAASHLATQDLSANISERCNAGLNALACAIRTDIGRLASLAFGAPSGRPVDVAVTPAELDAIPNLSALVGDLASVDGLIDIFRASLEECDGEGIEVHRVAGAVENRLHEASEMIGAALLARVNNGSAA